jgi:hypothetical protein
VAPSPSSMSKSSLLLRAKKSKGEALFAEERSSKNLKNNAQAFFPSTVETLEPASTPSWSKVPRSPAPWWGDRTDSSSLLSRSSRGLLPFSRRESQRERRSFLVRLLLTRAHAFLQARPGRADEGRTTPRVRLALPQPARRTTRSKDEPARGRPAGRASLKKSRQAPGSGDVRSAENLMSACRLPTERA